MSDRGQTCGPTYVPVTVVLAAGFGILIYDEVEVAVQSPPPDAFFAELMALAAVGLVAVLVMAALYFRAPEEDDPA